MTVISCPFSVSKQGKAWLCAMEKVISFHPSTIEDDKKLLKNPDRGFRIETWCNVANLPDDKQRVHEDPADMLKKFVEYYEPESPQLAQVYFYMTGYKNTTEISQYGLTRIQQYFDEARRLGIRLLVRFAYQGDGDGTGEAADEFMLAHMQQLKPLLYKNRDIIHVVQSGFLGAWGEWHSYKMEHDRIRLIHAIADIVPPESFLQIRIPEFKNMLPKTDPLYSRIGYNNDSTFGYVPPEQAGRGTGGVDPGTPDWQQITEESPYVPVDGELFWGTWSMNQHWGDRDGFLIDGHGIIRELSEHRYNSLSVHHNYREDGPDKKYSMQYWQETELTDKWLDEYGLFYAPGWFKKADGTAVSRTVFEYVRDYVGYKLELRQLYLNGNFEAGSQIGAVLELVNYGFSVPFCMKSGFIMLDGNDRVVSEVSAGEPLDWHSRNPEDYADASLLTHKVEASITLPSNPGFYKLAFYLRNAMGTGARMGNTAPFCNGVTILCDLSVE